MSTSARQFTLGTNDGLVDFGPFTNSGVARVGNLGALAGSFCVNVENVSPYPNASSPSYMLFAIGSDGIAEEPGGVDAFYCFYANNQLFFRFLDGNGLKHVFLTQGDPFGSAGVPIAGWQLVTWSWLAGNESLDLRIGPIGSHPTSQPLNSSGSGAFSLSANTANRLILGTNAAFRASDWGWETMPGLALADVAFYTTLTAGARSLLEQGWPSTVVDPANTIEAGICRLGAATETGVYPNVNAPLATTANGSILHADVVAGPALSPGFAAVFTPASSTVHSPGTDAITATWSWQNPPASAVNFTPTPLVGSVSPTSITLGTAGTDTASVTLTVPGSVTPPADGSVSWANDGGLIAGTSDIGVVAPPVTATINITPDRNILLVLMDASPFVARTVSHAYPAAVTDVADGATLTVAGKVIPLDGIWAYDHYNRFAYRALNQEDMQIVDAGDASGVTLGGGGTWSSTTQVDTGLKAWYGTTIHHNTDTSATATVTFATVLPGKMYRVQWPMLIPFDSISFADAATVRVTVTDGLTTDHVDIDQTQAGVAGTVAGSDDWVAELYHWTDLLIFTVRDDIPSPSLTVTFTNPGGTGTTYLDAIRIEHIQSRSAVFGGTPARLAMVDGTPAVPVGVTPTLDAPDNWITTLAGSTGLITALPVTVLDDATYMPFDAARTRTMKVGYQLGKPYDQSSVSRCYANMLHCSWSPWEGAASTDAAGNLTGITAGGTAGIRLVSGSIGDGIDGRGNVTAVPGWFRITYDDPTPGATTGSLWNYIGERITIDPTVVKLAGDDTGTGGVHHDFLQHVTFNPPTASLYQNFIAIGFQITSNGATVDWGTVGIVPRVYGPDVTMRDGSTTGMDNPSWVRLAHPTMADRIGDGRGFALIRAVDFLGENSSPSNVANFSDWVEGKVIGVVPTKTISLPVVSVGPANVTDTVNDPDQAIAYFSGNGFSVAKVKVDVSSAGGSLAAAGVVPGMWPLFDQSIRNVAFGTNGLVTTNQPTGRKIFLTDPALFVIPIEGSVDEMLVYGGSGVDDANELPAGAFAITPDTVYTPSGSINFIINPAKTPLNLIDLANDVGISPWITLPNILTAAAAQALGAWAAAHLDSSLGCTIEWSNEYGWNHFYTVSQWGTAVAHKLGIGVQDFYCQRIIELYDAFVAAWVSGGRDAADVTRVLGSQMFTGPTADKVAYLTRSDVNRADVFDVLAIAPYLDADAATERGTGGVTPDGSSRAQLDYSGLVSLMMLHAREMGVDDVIAQHQAILNGAGLATKRIVTYEGGPEQWFGVNQQIPPPGPTAKNCLPQQHPRAYHFNLAWLQFLEESGISHFSRQTYDIWGDQRSGKTWLDWYSPYETPGTGTETENPNPGLMRPNTLEFADPNVRVSQMGGAMRTFAALTLPAAQTYNGSAAVTTGFRWPIYIAG